MGKIRIKIHENGKVRELVVNSSDTIGNAKKLVKSSSSRWLFNGMMRTDGQTFDECGIEDGDNIMSICM